MGAVTQAFEDGLARFLGLDARYVLATNTGTSALHLGLLAAGVSRGDEVVTAIDGGAVVVGDPATLERLRHWRFLGIDRETLERYKNSRAWEYDVVSQGFRYHMTNINAAVGLSQLGRAPEFIAARRRSCRLYYARLAGVDGVRGPVTAFEDSAPLEGGNRHRRAVHRAGGLGRRAPALGDGAGRLRRARLPAAARVRGG